MMKQRHRERERKIEKEIKNECLSVREMKRDEER